MKKILFIYTTILTLHIYAETLFDIGIPKVTGELIINQNYILQYNEDYEQADWVYYELTKNEVLGNIKRKDSFRADPRVKDGSSTLDDYKGSGYDRGHLAPAADMKMSSNAMEESFYLSNMSPQDPAFNRGIWSKLEKQIRDWALQYNSIYVVTGPYIESSNPKRIGSNRVAVPNYFYKVVLIYNDKEARSIGFLLPNKKGEFTLQEYAVTVNDIEDLTHLDFFSNLPNDIEESVEKSIDIALWDFNN